ncbi:MAG: F0F1 ATP synthase subunit delta [Rickettsiales bacterium]|nr:F0F1 ATP synthase subunit delta [Rickettsiales bacterium]
MKASEQQIAQRYVTALLGVAKDDAALAQVEKDLLALQNAYAQDAGFREVLANPLLGRTQLAGAMAEVLKTLKAHALTQQFVAMVANQKRLTLLPQIATLFEEALMARRGELAVELVSAVALSDKEIEAVRAQLAKAYGKKITIKTRVNPEILGGVVINIGSTQLDGSLSGKLRRLGQQLKAA